MCSCVTLIFICRTTLYSQPCSSFGLYLLDNHRISQLYLSTGKTKKKLPSLAEVQPRLTLTCCSHNGAYLAGLTTSGQLFVWHQPTEVLEIFQTPLSSPQEATEEEKGGHSFRAFQGMYFSLGHWLKIVCTAYCEQVAFCIDITGTRFMLSMLYIIKSTCHFYVLLIICLQLHQLRSVYHWYMPHFQGPPQFFYIWQVLRS